MAKKEYLPHVTLQSLGGIPSEADATTIMGSCHKVTMQSIGKKQSDKTTIILDVGSYGNIEKKSQAEIAQLEGLGNLSDIAAIFVSHVHIDHIGNLVGIVKVGYKGHIYMTHDSKALFVPMINDTLAILRKENAEKEEVNTKLRTKLNKYLSIVTRYEKAQGNGNGKNGNGNGKNGNKGHSAKPATSIQEEHSPDTIAQYKNFLAKHAIVNNNDIAAAGIPLSPIPFDEHDIRQTISQIRALDRDKKSVIVGPKGVSLTAKFLKAGHLEGAAQTILSFGYDPYNQKEQRRLLYEGDLGRVKEPLLVTKPEPIKEKVNATIMESTYGNRIHTERGPEIESFIDEIQEATGPVIIPAFANGRSAEAVSILVEALNKGTLILNPGEKIYIDGKLTDAILTTLLTRYPEAYSFLTHPAVYIITNEGEKKALYDTPGRKIIIASGGMLQGGAAIFHAHKVISNPKAKILTIGYQAFGTRGNYLQGQRSNFIYNHHTFEQKKHLLYNGIHTHKKIAKRGEEKVVLSCHTSKELERILEDIYDHQAIRNLTRNEYIYVPAAFWEDHDKFIRAATNLATYNPAALKYIKKKIRTIDDDETLQNKSLLDIEDDDTLRGVFIVNDTEGKVKRHAQFHHFSTFSGHADRDELIHIAEKTPKHAHHKTILVHGEDKARAELAAHLEKNKYVKGKVIVPALYEILTLTDSFPR